MSLENSKIGSLSDAVREAARILISGKSQRVYLSYPFSSFYLKYKEEKELGNQRIYSSRELGFEQERELSLICE